MSRRQLFLRARLVIAAELMVNHLKITEESEFRADLGADSLDLPKLHAALEDEFKVSISDDEADFCQTVGTAIDLIEAKLESGQIVPPFLRRSSR